MNSGRRRPGRCAAPVISKGGSERARQGLDGAALVEAAPQQRRHALGFGQDLEGHLGDETRAYPGAASNLTRSSPVTFFITRPPDLTTSPRPLTALHADQTVARRPGHDAAGPGEIHGRDRADGRFAPRAEKRPIIHRLEGQLLALLGQNADQFGQGRAAPRRDHQLGGFIERDAVIAVDASRRPTSMRPPERGLAVRAADGERLRSLAAASVTIVDASASSRGV